MFSLLNALFVFDSDSSGNTLSAEQCKAVTNGMTLVPLRDLRSKSNDLKEQEFMTVSFLSFAQY